MFVVCGTLTLDTTERAGVVQADIPGGSALYAAAGASSRVPVRMLGTVGTDFPAAVMETLTSRGIDTTAVERLDGPTFRWHAVYDPAGGARETRLRDRGVAEGRLPPVPLPPRGRHALLLGSTHPDVQTHVRIGHPEAALVGLDSMAHWWSSQTAALRALLPRVDVLFVDPEELRLATGTLEETLGVARLQAAGPEIVVLKRGAAGATLYRRGGAPQSVAAVSPQAVVDTTGAGDAFAGALLASLLCRESDGVALLKAAARASQAIAGVGIAGLL